LPRRTPPRLDQNDINVGEQQAPAELRRGGVRLTLVLKSGSEVIDSIHPAPSPGSDLTTRAGQSCPGELRDVS
jgi:hypothetical protein